MGYSEIGLDRKALWAKLILVSVIFLCLFSCLLNQLHPKSWGIILGGVMVLLKFIWDTLIPIEFLTGTLWWENSGLGYLDYKFSTMRLWECFSEPFSAATKQFTYWSWATLQIASNCNKKKIHPVSFWRESISTCRHNQVRFGVIYSFWAGRSLRIVLKKVFYKLDFQIIMQANSPIIRVI